MEGIIPSIYDIEFWKNIAVLSIGFSAILVMVIFRLIYDIRLKIDSISKQINNFNRKCWFEDDPDIFLSKKSKLHRIIDEESNDDQ
ncbi:MAG: hypothetical protein QXD03_02375 [Candidatus Anstonellales archaeon]